MRVFSGQHTHPGGCAERYLAVSVLKIAARFRKPIEIRRLHNTVAFTSDSVWTVFVAHEKEDIRFLNHRASDRLPLLLAGGFLLNGYTPICRNSHILTIVQINPSSECAYGNLYQWGGCALRLPVPIAIAERTVLEISAE